MPKVLRIINRFNLGGITYNVSYLSRYLPEKYETLLIGGPEEKGEESSLFIPHSLGLQPMVIREMRRSVNPFQDLMAYFKIKKIIREFKPDIVHTHASKAGLVGRIAAKHCHVPVIVHTFHGHVFSGYFPFWLSWLVQKTERFVAGYCKAIIAISNKQKTELSTLYKICDAGKITLIPLGFDLTRFNEKQEEKRTRFRSQYGLKENEIAVGIIGRLVPIKNHRLFIDAIQFARANCAVKFRAFIIGDGNLRTKLEEYIQSHHPVVVSPGPPEDLITFTGWIKEADIALAGLDLVCLTSINEGTPVSLIEAQAAGKFIVSTNVGGIEDILHPECGLLSAANDEESYKKNLLYALMNFSILSKSAGVAQKEILEKFSYQRLCSEMGQLYDKLLDSEN